MKKNPVNWFEIPVDDLDRARKFYESVFDVELNLLEMGPMKMFTVSDGGWHLRNSRHSGEGGRVQTVP